MNKGTKKKLAAGVFLLLAGIGLATAIDSRAREGMVIPIDDLREIHTSSSWELTVEEGNAGELRIIDARSSRSRVEYSRGILRLNERPGISLGMKLKKSRAVLVVPVLEASLDASSSSEITVLAPLEGEDIRLDASSSGRIHLGPVSANRLTVKASSSGRINAERVTAQTTVCDLSSSGKVTLNGGETRVLTTRLSSSARLNAPDFFVKERLDLKGSSSAYQEFSVADTVDASGSVSSSADAVLHGNPPARSIQAITTSSSGKVEFR